MGQIIVVGGGPAGMIAAIYAAKAGKRVSLYEKNEKLGKKLFITGKGRCNVTNDCDPEELLANVISNPKFLYSAFYDFDAQKCKAFFEDLGVRLKTERGNRVFPLSDHSSDIIRALEYEMRRLGVEVHLNTPVKELIVDELVCKGVVLADGKRVSADRVLLATGGVSYPLTGADGSGLKMAERVGHKVTELYPALVPLRTEETWCHELMGLSLRNVSAKIKNGKKTLYEGFGEMLFTHFGVSGPLILSASSKIVKQLQKSKLTLTLDLKPALTQEQLDKRILRDFEQAHNKQFKNALSDLLPSRLIPVMIELSGISPEKKVNELTKAERLSFGTLLKQVPLTICGTGDFKEAIITQGGIYVKEINPSTMESKKIQGLYFAGECIDVDALTGGFNLQIAWSTGYLAGISM
ncbi:MAG: NAD(P)/FAD-dependent oxidoreductase [Lachnospiraceae bacterium]|nr:NAD(P)/FAD-dependent oxidoreductase [Lachnospiraceae bacterium]